jgi:hypothetical protein
MKTVDFLEALKRREILVAADDPKALALISDMGFARTVSFDDFNCAASGEPVFAVLTRYDSQHRMNQDLWDKCKDVFVHFTTAKFDADIDVLRYSLERLFSIDNYGAMLAKRDGLYEQALAASRIEVHSGNGQVLTGKLSDEVEAANFDAELEIGWLYSLAELLEASIVNAEADRSSFVASGSMAFDGIIHLENTAELKADAADMVAEMTRLAQAGNNLVECEDNNVVRLVLGGQDYTETLTSWYRGTDRELSLVEFSFGVVDHATTPNWSKNSILNEGALGMHAGIGMGMHAPHIDFISHKAELRFID